MVITVQELIEALEGLHPGTEVRIASQPNWPFEYSVEAVAVVETGENGEEVVYLAEGSQIGYLPGAVKDEIGW